MTKPDISRTVIIAVDTAFEMDGADVEMALDGFATSLESNCLALGGCSLRCAVDTDALFPGGVAALTLTCGTGIPIGCRAAELSDNDIETDVIAVLEEY